MRSLMIVALCLCILPLGGCFSIFIPVASVQPMIRVVERPNIEIPENIRIGEDPKVDALIHGLYKYGRHIERLESAIEIYNESATAHNNRISNRLLGVVKKVEPIGPELDD